jgi:hypothetical protein
MAATRAAAKYFLVTSSPNFLEAAQPGGLVASVQPAQRHSFSFLTPSNHTRL